MDDVLTFDPAPHGRDLALLSRRTLGLTELLRRRPELRGVSTWTEEMAELLLWSA